jgi:acyl-CoA-binding protein
VSSNLDTDFRQAAEDVKHLPARPDIDTLLSLYAL